ncbi:putative ribosomal protein L2, domain 2 [Helianthus annuus]|nr:putative ribosomal protein L2, domain 2 [Helianthus annuus]
MRAIIGAAVAAEHKLTRLAKTLYSSSTRNYSITISTHNTTTIIQSEPSIFSADRCRHPSHQLLSVPWSVNQIRFAKARGSDVRPGNVIERKGLCKYYFLLLRTPKRPDYRLTELFLPCFAFIRFRKSLPGNVVKAQHSTQGRGGAIIQVELRDVDSGNKVNERFRTDETVEKIFVEAKSYTYLYTDEETDTIVLMEPNTFVQLDVPKHLFGNSLAYLKDDITVSVELFNDRPMSASVPKRVTCTVVEAQVPMKGMGATPHTKKVLLDNGLRVEVPPHVVTGDKILIDTTNDSYISRA